MTIFTTLAGRTGAIAMIGRWGAELRTNRRAIAGLLLIAVLAAGEGLLVLHDAGDRMRASYGRELVRLDRVTAIGQERDWPQRAAAATAVRAQLESRLWAAESDGVARADLQDWVTRMARDVGLSTLDVRIELATPQFLPSNLRQITATITAQPSESALIALLEHVERAPHLLVVDRLNVKQQPGPYLEMVLICYARIGPGVAANTVDRAKPR